MGGAKKAAKLAKGGACVSLKAMQTRSAQAWQQKKKKVTDLSDLPVALIVHILAFLTKREGNAVYVHEKVQYPLNLVCRTWFYHLERARCALPSNEGPYAGIVKWAGEKAVGTPSVTPSSSAKLGPRSNPVSPALCAGEDTSRPHVLVLTELAHPIPHSPSDDVKTEATTLDDAKAALRRIAQSSAGKKDCVLILMRMFKCCRTLLSDKVPFVRTDLSAGRRAEGAKATELLKWAVREFSLDVNTTDGCQRTPLHTACLYNDLPCAKVLLAAGADVTLRDKRGATCLHYAAGGGCSEIAQLIVSRDDTAVRNCLNKKDAGGFTPLELAGRYKHVLCMQIVSKRQKSMLATKDDAARVDDDDEEADEDGLTHERSNSSFSSERAAGGGVLLTPPEKRSAPQQPRKKAKKPVFDDCEEKALAYGERHW